MRWDEFLGHRRQRAWFENAIRANRLGSTFLFVGPEGIGKRTMAKMLAKSLLCPNRISQELLPCERCESCAQVEASTHPDLLQVSKPEDKTVLPIDLFLGGEESRGREGFIHEIGLKSFYGHGKVALIDDADFFSEESANSLLKTLEEPPLGVRIFLIGTSVQRQLPTIRSRCQIVRFQDLPQGEMIQLALRVGLVDAEVEARSIAEQGIEGSLNEWRRMTDSKVVDFRTNLHERLCHHPIDLVGLSKAMVSAVDAAGKEGPERKASLKLLFHFSIELFRMQWKLATGILTIDQVAPSLRSPLASNRMVRARSQVRPIRAISRTLEAISEVDRNIVAAAIIEAWIADIAILQEI